jgi:hypothetical protein
MTDDWLHARRCEAETTTASRAPSNYGQGATIHRFFSAGGLSGLPPEPPRDDGAEELLGLRRSPTKSRPAANS